MVVRYALLITLLIPLVALGQSTGKISGTVVDDNGQPVVGANIVVEGTKMGATSDTEGSFFIINVPPQTYVVRASAVGFTTEKMTNLRVVQGLTTSARFKLKASAVEMGEIVVEHTRPAVQKDLTAKLQGFDASDIDRLPVQTTIQDLLTKQAGITREIMTTPISSQPVFGQFATVPTDGLHFRGGRVNETLYLFDGITVNDGLWGGFDIDAFGFNSLSSLRTLTGTFGPQYGEAMSGVVEMSTIDNVPSVATARFTGYTDRLGENSGTQHTNNYELYLAAPIPGVPSLGLMASARRFTSDGYLYGHIYPEYVDTRGQDKSGTLTTVPMAFRDTDLLMGKLIWQLSEAIKFRVGAFNTQTQRGTYGHYFKYNPYGMPHAHLNDFLVYGRWTHVLSQQTFYDVSVSWYDRKFKSHVYDDSLSYVTIPQNGTAEFSISGEDWVYFNSEFNRFEAQGILTSQVTKEHLLSGGITFDGLRTKLARLNPDGFAAIEDYDFHPKKWGAFVNDKMEFEEIGLIINLGLRYDWINPNREYISNIESPEGTVAEVSPRAYFSPRFGISYPITDVAAFRFGYGVYNQYPDFFKAFQGTNQQYTLYPAPNVRSVSGAVATGDIQEERSVNYEVGVQVKVSPSISMDLTGFYRKISNLIGIVVVEGYITDNNVTKAQKFPVFDNISTATVQGIELSVTKRFTDAWSAFFNYTYSQTLTTSSVLFSVPRDMSRTYPADWDQPHVASFGISFEFPSQWGFSFLGNIGSGLPYTYTQFRPNEERAPWTGSFDAMVFKNFTIGFVDLRIFAQVFNLMNRRNVWWVYPDSGKPGIDTNPSTSDDYTNDPSMWGPGRRFQIGLGITL
jgi:outer membrane receptor for ferrienterochelin and colicin